MKVCYFGTYRSEYSRNRIMIEGLRRNGVTVLECHENLWEGIEDRIKSLTGGWKKPGFWFRLIRVYIILIRKYFLLENHDVVIVGYPGQLDVFLARALSWLRKKPVIWDIFMSIYLISLERGLKDYMGTRMLKWLERNACALPDRLILDTEDYVKWFASTHRVSPERFRLVPTGADDRIFFPRNVAVTPGEIFTVIYFGTFIPNHHVQTIVDAARFLSGFPDILIKLVGTGPDLPECTQMAENYHLRNVKFIEWVDEEMLTDLIANSQVVLGAFGDTPQSMMTIQNKIYTGLAMAKPVISGDSTAIRRELQDKKHILLCNRKDPQSLAETILLLYRNPQLAKKISIEGYRLFTNRFSLEKIGSLFYQHLVELMAK